MLYLIDGGWDGDKIGLQDFINLFWVCFGDFWRCGDGQFGFVVVWVVKIQRGKFLWLGLFLREKEGLVGF